MLLFATLALAGDYGVVVDGQPDWSQREMHTYTNLVRVDPEAWEDLYDCSLSSFSSSERSAKAPLQYHDGLTTIAQLHSEDMASCRSMQHESCDGTEFGDRVGPYYSGTIGENVAWGYVDNADVVWGGWMCSSGHRANIMYGSFDHFGGGESNSYYTQNFGGGESLADAPVAMGVHTPERPTSTVTFYATWDDSQAPAQLAVETEDDCIDLESIAGSAKRAAVAADADAGSGCQRYRFVWERQDGERGALPESGSYQYGNSCDPWVSGSSGRCDPEDDDTDDTGCGELDFVDRNGDCEPDPVLGEEEACGCASASPVAGWWLLPLLSLVRRRR